MLDGISWLLNSRTAAYFARCISHNCEKQLQSRGRIVMTSHRT